MEKEDWASDLDKALTSFVIENSKTQWPASDMTKIKEVVLELGLDGARFAFNSNLVFDVEEGNPWKKNQGVLHIHSTMLVSQVPFKGSIDRGIEPYPLHRHFYALSNFVDKSSGVAKPEMPNQVLCPHRFIWVAAGFECSCGDTHNID